MDVERFRAGRDAIRGASKLIVQFTSGGAVGDAEDDRIAPLDLGPDMASLTTGTVNFGNESKERKVNFEFGVADITKRPEYFVKANLQILSW